jgi:hypothetical protein
MTIRLNHTIVWARDKDAATRFFAEIFALREGLGGHHYSPLGRLQLHHETKIFLGLINMADGVEGAKKRIASAERVLPDFGVASYCGLGFPALAGDVETQLRSIGLFPVKSAVPIDGPKHPGLGRATKDNIDDVLLLHRHVAEL